MSGITLYHISGRRQKRHRKKLLRRRILIVFAVFLALLLLFSLRLRPLLIALAEVEATNAVEELLSAAISREMRRDPALYSDVITLRYKADGSVSSLSADTARLLSIRTSLLLCVLEELRTKDALSATVPLSSLLGLNFLSARSGITVDLRLEREMNAYFTSHFEECGINQTRHSITFFISVKIAVLVPSRIRYITVNREFPFAETVIVGNVPDAYTEISRLTSDITETEIDDIYDFGAAR